MIACGSRFDDRVTGQAVGVRARGARVIHLDIDAAEIGKLRHADIPVVGPLKQVLRDLAAELQRKLVARARPDDRAVARARSPTGGTSSRCATRRRATR